MAAGAAAYVEKSFMNFDEVRKKLQGDFPGNQTGLRSGAHTVYGALILFRVLIGVVG
jgi:hypothetical protein